MSHPGEILADELRSRKIKQIDFAQRIGMAPTQLNEILKGKRPISPEFALLLDWFFIGTAEYWLQAQSTYELEKARLTFTPPTPQAGSLSTG